MFTNYNDYELLYLIKDGNPKALNMMFLKYDVLIKKTALKILGGDDKINDLIQEGRMQLYECIHKFDDSYEISFYSYFLICLRRRLKRELTKEYYDDFVCLRENLAVGVDLSDRILIRAYKREFKDDPLALAILDEHILRDLSVAELAKEYNIPYKKVINKKKEIIEAIKKIID